LIEHNDHKHEQNLEEDDNKALRRSKRQRTTKFFGDNFIMYLVSILLEPLKRHILLQMLTNGRKQYGVRWILLWLMVFGK
jgi:hypothetical protein